jgi:osmoprotectant transport system ATP-binding protein
MWANNAAAEGSFLGSPVRGQLSMAPYIELDRLCKSFDDGRTFAVHEVTLQVEPGLFVALVGASGSGKTTTLKFINRLIEPDSGTVRIEGEEVGASDPATLRRRIGYVFQGIGLFPHMSVGENVAITPQLLGWPQAEVAERVDELLDLVELPRGYASRSPSGLSGGEQQRVAVARAIAARPKIVLMDEPFGALDPITRDTVRSSYQSLHSRLGLTTIMVTHDVQEAALVADRIAVMSTGRILAYDTPRALLSTEAAAAEVANLMAMPKRQAERIRALTEGEPRDDAHG